MSDEPIDETCNVTDCDSNLVRVSADDPANAYNRPVVVCPACLEVKRIEESL